MNRIVSCFVNSSREISDEPVIDASIALRLNIITTEFLQLSSLEWYDLRGQTMAIPVHLIVSSRSLNVTTHDSKIPFTPKAADFEKTIS